jgi:transposase
MARAYSEDLRGRALDLLESGQKQQAVSKLLNIGLSTLKYWIKTWRTEGRRVAKSGYQKGHSHKITDTQVLQDIITKNPDKTLTEIGKMLPTPCAAETVRRGLKRLGFSYKKKEFHYKQRDSARCAAFLEMVSTLNPGKLCWIDQSGMQDTNLDCHDHLFARCHYQKTCGINGLTLRYSTNSFHLAF